MREGHAETKTNGSKDWLNSFFFMIKLFTFPAILSSGGAPRQVFQ